LRLSLRKISGAELDIILLRQQAKGGLVGQGGDIDNQLKTLFEALRIPSKAEVQELEDAILRDEDPRVATKVTWDTVVLTGE
jgi:hypothetical protein